MLHWPPLPAVQSLSVVHSTFSQLAISYANVEEEVPSADGDSADGYAVVDGDASATDQTLVSSRQGGLIASLTIFVLAIFVGFEVITKVPPTLHTPLMSGSNAISGITVVAALIAAGASIEATGPDGLTPVLIAARQGAAGPEGSLWRGVSKDIEVDRHIGFDRDRPVRALEVEGAPSTVLDEEVVAPVTVEVGGLELGYGEGVLQLVGESLGIKAGPVLDLDGEARDSP